MADQSLLGLLRWRASVSASRVAFTFLGERDVHAITYGELDARARALGERLLEYRGLRVLLLYPPGLDYIVAFFACLYAGAVAVPTYPPRSSRHLDRLLAIAQDAQPALALTTTAAAGAVEEMIERLGGGMACLVAEGNDETTSWVPEGAEPGALAFLQYTSGSTSDPKGVMLSHASLLANLAQICGCFALTAESVGVNWLPPYHDMGLIGSILAPIYAGCHSVLMAPAAFMQSPRRWLEAISRYQGTTAGAPNFAYDLCVQAVAEAQRGELDLSSWAVAFNGAEPVRAETMRRFQEAFAPAGFHASAWLPCYGLAEAALIVTGTRAHAGFSTARLDGEELAGRELVSSGPPAAGQRVVIVDPVGLTPCAAGQVGEIWVGGSSLAEGYWGREAESFEAFGARLAAEPGTRFLRTGDLGCLRADGELVVTGRIKDLVVLRGRNHYPQDLELTAERAHGAFQAGGAAAFAIETAGEERLALALELRREAVRRDPGEALEAVRAAIATHHGVDVGLVALLRPGQLPRTSSGKVQRRACRAALLDGTLGPAHTWQRGATSTAALAPVPTTDATTYLRTAVATLVGSEPDAVPLDRPLPALGLDSLASYQLLHAIERERGTVLTLEELLEAPDLATLAARLEATGPNVGPDEAGEEAGPSADQRALWLLQRAAPESAAYNLPLALRLPADVDVAALKRALEALVARHEAMRTTFPDLGGLQVHAEARLPWEDVDAAGWSEDARAAWLADVAHRPFDLAAGPPVRAALLRHPEEPVLLLVGHHIALDMWSLSLLLADLGPLYRGADLGRPAASSRRRSGASDGSLAFWQARLAGELPRLELPTDRPRPAVRSQQGAWHRFTLDASLAGPLGELARREGATLHAVLLAAFYALLHRQSGQPGLVVGTPMAGRPRAADAEVVGYLATMVALREDLADDPSFAALVRRTAIATREAATHQLLPLSTLLQALGGPREPSRTPLFQAAFVLEQAHLRAPGAAALALGSSDEPVDLGGLVVRPFPLARRAAQFDLTLLVAEGDGALQAAFEYDTALFDGWRMAGLAKQLETLLAGAVAAPETPVSRLPLLTAAEREQVVVGWNATAATYPADRSVWALFADQSRERPDAVALECGSRVVSYAELAARAEALAGELVARGVGPGVRVGVCLERSVELVVAVLGVLAAGGAYVPLDPAYPAARLAFMREDAGCHVVIGGELDVDGPVPPRSDVALPICGPDDPAYVIYTSGSTGTPKGVLVPHRAVVRLVRGQDFISISPDDVFLQLAPTSFDASTLELWGPLLNGGRLAIAPPGPVSLDDLRHVLARHGVTILWLTAGLFHLAVDEGMDALAGVKQLLAGGDVLSPAHVQRFLAALPGCKLVNGYGPTENTTFSTCFHVRPGSFTGAVPIGRPIANSQAYVLDGRLEPVPVGVDGELYVGGAGLALGYMNQPELTAERFLETAFGRLYRTGDRARWLPDGNLAFMGRLDQQLKVRGFRVEPGEIEAALLAHPAVQQAAVVARGDALVAYWVGAEADEETIAVHLAARLPAHLLPGRCVRLAALPLTANGKLDRGALPAPGTEPAGDACMTPTEAALAGLFAELLGHERVGPTDDFFTLGGHSLLAARLASRAGVPLRAVFEHPSVRALARFADLGPVGGPIARISRSGRLALSSAQLRLWFLDKLAPGGKAYHVVGAFRLEGALDEAALQCALDEIVARHEALRTTFHEADGEALQAIAPPQPVQLVRLAAPGQREALHEVRQAMFAPFDLATGPLLRAQLVRLGDGAWLLALGLHHIVADGWSVGVFARELAALYGAFASGVASPLPPLGIQHADYGAWQRARLTGPRLAELQAFWRQRLAGVPTSLPLPADRPRTVPRAGQLAVALPPGLAAAVESFARERGATVFQVLLASFALLLARLSGRDDLLVGLPTANRAHAETEALIGLFVNTVPLRVELGGDPGFAAVLARVREASVAALAHQELPFEQVLELVEDVRQPGLAPLCQVLFQVLHEPLALALPGLACRAIEVPPEEAKVDLSLTLIAHGGEVAGTLEFRADRFDEATVGRWMDHWQTLLAAAMRDEDRPVGALPLVSADGRAIALALGVGETVPQPAGTLWSLFADQARQRPHAVALVCGAREVSYAELAARAEALAGELVARGVGPGVRVGVCLERSIALVVAVLGVLAAGGAYVPLDPAYPAARLAFMREDAGCSVVVGGELDVDGPVPPRSAVALPICGPDDPAYVIYTSGSTGTPKGVLVPHRGVLNMLAAVQRLAPLGPEDVGSLWTSFGFDVSVYELFSPLVLGATLALPPAASAAEPERMVAWLAERRVTSAYLPPAFLEALRAAAEPPALRRLLVGVEPIDEQLLGAIAGQLPELVIVNGYGPTEATICATMYKVEGASPPRRTPIGRPLPNVQVYVLDGRLEPVPVGVDGELFIGGAGVALGYLNRPELTAERFVHTEHGRLYRTGDRARWLPDGNLAFMGRLDQQLKVRGFRIEPGEVEAALLTLPGIRQAVVGASEQALVAYLETDEVLDPAGLRTRLRAVLPEHMVPARFVGLPAFPLTPNGKVDRAALAALVTPAATTDEPPQGPVEEAICRLWAELFGLEAIGRDADFFALGGHSLLAVRLASRIRQAFGVEFSVRDCFLHPTIAAQAACLASASGAVAPLRPRPREGALPLASAQRRLWFLDRLSPGGYVMAGALRLDGALDVPALERAIAGIIRRHESLRTTFRLDQGEPAQVVHPAMAVRLRTRACQEPQLQAALAAEADLPFDLEAGPLLRATLFRLSEASQVLLITMHHVVSDGWSVGIIVRELASLYASEVGGKPATLAEPALQYADYALWERDALAGAAHAAGLQFWRTALAGSPDVLTLPTDRPRPNMPSRRGASLPVAFPPALADGLQRLATERGMTLYMMVLAGFAAVLARNAGQGEVVIGSPTANRDRPELEPLVGCFVNTLALRVDLAGDPSFDELLRRVRHTTMAAFEHQAVPFEQVVEALDVGRELAHAPVFQALLAWQNTPAERWELPGLVAARVPLPATSAAFDLALSLEPSPAGLHGDLTYATELFDEWRMAGLVGQLHTLLLGALASPETPVSRLPLLTAAEREQVVVGWNATAAPYPADRSVWSLFSDKVQQGPEAVALVCGAREVSYAELAARAEALAGELVARGVGPGVRVGVCFERSVSLVVAVLGVLAAGGAYVPLDPAYPAARLAFMREDAGCSVVVEGELDVDGPVPPRSDVALPICTPDDPAYVIYTSGSTGTPKGVLVPHRGLANMVAAQVSLLGITPESRVLQFASPSFDAATWELFMAIATGATAIIPERHEHLPGPALEHLLQARAVTVATLPPTALALLDPARLPSLAVVVSAGEPCAPALARAWAVGRRFINAYGPTEASVCATMHEVDGDPGASLVPIGRPLPNVQVYVLDGRLEPVPVGVDGELFIGGAGVALGYLNRPELTAERFVHTEHGRLYRTGDRARWLPDGNLAFMGRLDQQLKVRGFRIEPGEVEAALLALPGIRQAVVGASEQALVAYLETDEVLDPVGLRTRLRAMLPEHLVPARFVGLPAFPLTPNGKVDRAALAALVTPAATTDEPPQGPVEEAICRLWAQLFGLEAIGRDADFFALGGHSLLAVRLQAGIEAELGARVPLHQLFQDPTPRGIAAYLGRVESVTTPQAAALDLEAEVRRHDLPDLVPQGEPAARPRKILLTGATGFLGTWLLAELLGQTDALLYCLVRGEDVSAGRRRLEGALRSKGLWQASFGDRLVPVLGDLAQPGFGLAPAAFEALAGELDQVVHNGAWVHHLYPYATLAAANVGGTREALRLAMLGRPKAFHHVSTAGVVAGRPTGSDGLVPEDAPLALDGAVAGGYVESKWAAERLVQLAGARGLPVSIYRPGRAWADRVNGHQNPADSVVHLLQGCLEAGSAPDLPLPLDLVPVDAMARALAYLTTRPSSAGQVFHLTNPTSPTFNDLIEAARAKGHPIERVPLAAWGEAVLARATEAPAGPLAALAPLVTSLVGLDAAAAPRFSRQRALDALAAGGLDLPGPRSLYLAGSPTSPATHP